MLWEDNHRSHGISVTCTGIKWTSPFYLVMFSAFKPDLILFVNLAPKMSISGNCSWRHHRDCSKWDNRVVTSRWERRDYSSCKKHCEASYTRWEEAYNGKERLWEGQRNLSRAPHGRENSCSTERSVEEVQEPLILVQLGLWWLKWLYRLNSELSFLECSDIFLLMDGCMGVVSYP